MKQRLPLEGIRAIDFSQAALGPMATRFLAELGADVIKVEPLEGDFTRLTAEPGVDSVTFMLTNLNKRSLALNLKEERGLGIAKKLCETADVVVQNFRPGVMKRLGLDFESLSKVNPRLIYGSFSMYGETGPLAHRRGGDMWAQAFTGLVASQGNPDGPPQMVGHTVIDYCGAVVNAYAILAALYNRERTGVGMEVFNNLVNTGVYLQGPAISHYLIEGLLFKKVGRGAARTRFPYGAYTAKDGDVMTIFGQDDEEWKVICKMLGIEHLLSDPRYDTADKRDEKRFELYPVLDQAFKKKTRAEWAELFRQQRLRADPCLDYAELVDHPQFAENRAAVTVEDPREGEIQLVATPARFSIFPQGLPSSRHAPILGQHTKEVLKELGHSEAEIEELAEQGVAGIPTPDMFQARRTKGVTMRRTGGVFRGMHEEQRKREQQPKS